MIQEYLKQSGYLALIRLKRLIAPRVMALLMLFFGAAVALAVGCYFYFNSLNFIEWSKIFLAGFLITLVYELFILNQQSEKNLDAALFRNFVDQEEFGRLFSEHLAEVLYRSCDQDEFYPRAFFHFLATDYDFHWQLLRLNIPAAQFFAEINQVYPQDLSLPLSEFLRTAASKSLTVNHANLGLDDWLISLLSNKNFADILFKFKVKEEDLREVGDWQRRKAAMARQIRDFLSRENLLRIKGIGKDWSGGFTVNLDKYARNITRQVQYQQAPFHLYGHRQYIELIERGLLEGFGKVIVVGEPGVGRHTVIKAFAQAVNNGQTYGQLRYMRMLQIDSASILMGTATANESLDKIRLLFGEALAAGDVILVINNFDAFLDSKPEVGRINATEALLSYFKSPLKIIGITNQNGYASTIGKNTELQHLITKVEISETDPSETLVILQDECATLESKSLRFTNAALREIVNLCTKLIQNLPNPEKSLEVLEETALFVLTKTSNRLVLSEHVQKVITLKTKIPVEKVAGAEKDILLHLENLLQERIVGQQEALVDISNALRRGRSGISSEKRPIGSFLFLGPTGVGKTETTKALAAVYFGNENRIIRFDMSEYQEVHAINRMIGDADTREGGTLTEKVIENPFSLILLDEVEKAHPKILDLFLQVLDEGHLTDALGRQVSFVNTMLIATSNAGAELIRELVSQGVDQHQLKTQLIEYLQRQGLFRPEFLNRFDAVVTFQPLSSAELTVIATLEMTDLNRRLADKDIKIKITPELTQVLAQRGFSPEFGARPLRRLIQDRIESYIAQGLLSNTIKRGQEVEIPSEILAKED